MSYNVLCQYLFYVTFILQVSNLILAEDRKCERGTKCLKWKDCPQYLEYNILPRDGRNKLRASICNLEETKLCCPDPVTPEPSIVAKGPPEIMERDSKCKEGTACVPKEQCPQYQIIEHVPETHPDFQKLEEKWRARICKIEGKRFCCPECQEYPGNYLPKPGECRKKYLDTSRIIGGLDADLREFPWAVLLGYKVKRRWFDLETYKIKETTWYRCGGTLINIKYVLTAAHCHEGNNQVSTVVLGEWEVGVDPDCPKDSQDPEECSPKRQVIEVERVKIHPGYINNKNTGELINDIALIRLRRHAILNIAVQPICLPLNEEQTAEDIGAENLVEDIIGRDAAVIGWGATEPFQTINLSWGVAQKILQKLSIPIVSNEYCKSQLSGLTQEGVDIIGPKHICAGQKGSSKDTPDSCKGDSGGGMFIQNWWGNNITHEPPHIYYITHYQIGILPFGWPICGNGHPGAFTRITSYISWIIQNIYE